MSQDNFSRPIDDRYFEDYTPGIVCEYGPVDVTESEIVAFARRYDPQVMHLDPERAAAGPFGGLIASGFLSLGLASRLYMDNYLTKVASLGSPGLDEVRWKLPVRPGDVLRLRVRIVSATRSRSKPDRGLVRTDVELLNQDDQVAMSFNAMNLIRCRSPAVDQTEG
jgi:acyl dehydratase